MVAMSAVPDAFPLWEALPKEVWDNGRTGGDHWSFASGLMSALKLFCVKAVAAVSEQDIKCA